MMSKLTYSALVVRANLARLEDDLKALESVGCNELHFDVMDGVFVPDFALGVDVIKAARRCCGLPCHAHLMISTAERHVDRFIDAGCATVTVHVESCTHTHSVLARIREAGVSPGIAINPGTPLTKLDFVLDYVDRVLVMAVDPGYAGRKIVPSAFERVSILRENLDHRKLDAEIEVEGDIDVDNGAILANQGATILALGAAGIFNGAGDVAQAFGAFKTGVAAARNIV